MANRPLTDRLRKALKRTAAVDEDDVRIITEQKRAKVASSAIKSECIDADGLVNTSKVRGDNSVRKVMVDLQEIKKSDRRKEPSPVQEILELVEEDGVDSPTMRDTSDVRQWTNVVSSRSRTSMRISILDKKTDDEDSIVFLGEFSSKDNPVPTDKTIDDSIVFVGEILATHATSSTTVAAPTVAVPLQSTCLEKISMDMPANKTVVANPKFTTTPANVINRNQKAVGLNANRNCNVNMVKSVVVRKPLATSLSCGGKASSLTDLAGIMESITPIRRAESSTTPRRTRNYSLRNKTPANNPLVVVVPPFTTSTPSCMRQIPWSFSFPLALRLRPIVIDGSNVAISFGKQKAFDSLGLLICAHFFITRGHRVMIFVPQHRSNTRRQDERIPLVNGKIVDWLYDRNLLSFTPSRYMEGSRNGPNGDLLRFSCYDDYYVVQYAHQTGGVMVSNDHYKDVYRRYPVWRSTILTRLLMFSWVNDTFMLPVDPLGARGPDLEQFLQFKRGEFIPPMANRLSCEQMKMLAMDVDSAMKTFTRR